MAMDIIKLSKKLEQKDLASQKRFEQMDQEMKKTKEKLYKLIENERKRTAKQKAQTQTVEDQHKMVDDKRSQAKQPYDEILKKLDNLSREVHNHAKMPLKKTSEKYLTNETDPDYLKQENKILSRINQLEVDLEKIKSTSFLTANSN